MRINVDFELDWVNDEDTIDAAVSRKIIDKAVEQASVKVIETIKKNVDNQLANKVDEFLNDILAKFMDRNIVVTDSWGNEVTRYEDVNELLEEKFDAFVTEVVDSNGKTSRERGCSVSGDPRFEHLIKKHINQKIRDIELQITKEINEYFKSKINEAQKNIQQRTIETYMKTIDFEAGLKGKD